MNSPTVTEEKPGMSLWVGTVLGAVIAAMLVFVFLGLRQKTELILADDVATVTQKLPSQSLCVKKLAQNHIRDTGDAVGTRALAIFTAYCEGANAKDAAAKAQLKSLGLLE